MNKTWLIFFMLIFCFSKAQVFQRFSDGKTVDSVTVINSGRKNMISQSNFKNYKFKENDKILYDNKLLDFAITNDTLFFFDKVKEIEEVEIVNSNNKKEKKLKSGKMNASAAITPNSRIATLVRISTRKKTFVKSFTIQVSKFQIAEQFDGILEIQLLKNLNGFPEDSSELVSFEKDLSELIGKRKPFTSKNLEITLPRIFEYPKDGFFIVFNLKTNQKNTVGLKLNNESNMFMYYPKEGWKKLSFNSYYYQLKVLQ